MVLPNGNIITYSGRISQSETSTITDVDVVNISRCLEAIKMSLRQYIIRLPIDAI